MPSTLNSNWPQIATQTSAAVESGLLKVGEQMRDRLIARMREPKHGVIRRGHQASAPGEAPAVETGTLAGSLKVEAESRTSVAVYSDDAKAAWLEYGTKHVAPRPNFVVVAEEMRSLAPEILAAAIRASLR